MRRTDDRGGARARLVGLIATFAAVAFVATGCTSHTKSTSSTTSTSGRAKLELASVSGRTKPPCRAPAVLDAEGQRCLALGTHVATNADVVNATVMYATGGTYAAALTLDHAAYARIGELTQVQTNPFPGFVDLAVLVNGRLFEVIPALGSGQSLLLEPPTQTRAQAVALAESITGRTPAVQGGPNDVELTLADHWHVALGVDDYGKWVPNWGWPPGTVTNVSAVGAGAPARAGSNGQVYAGLHSHGDGIIHLEPATTAEAGPHATLGLYFRYGGWSVSATAIRFVNVDEQNGNSCDGKPGVLRWSVNGVEQHGDPANARLHDGDVIELVFTTAGAAMPPKTAVPSYAALRSILGLSG